MNRSIRLPVASYLDRSVWSIFKRNVIIFEGLKRPVSPKDLDQGRLV